MVRWVFLVAVLKADGKVEAAAFFSDPQDQQAIMNGAPPCPQ